MIEPTESESLAELDNFVDVMLNIWQEIQEVKNGEADKDDNVLILSLIHILPVASNENSPNILYFIL